MKEGALQRIKEIEYFISHQWEHCDQRQWGETDGRENVLTLLKAFSVMKEIAIQNQIAEFETRSISAKACKDYILNEFEDQMSK